MAAKGDDSAAMSSPSSSSSSQIKNKINSTDTTSTPPKSRTRDDNSGRATRRRAAGGSTGAAMSDRMRQRLNKVQSERNLGSSSRRSGRPSTSTSHAFANSLRAARNSAASVSGSRSTRSTSSRPSTLSRLSSLKSMVKSPEKNSSTTDGDDDTGDSMLLLQLTKKVRQLQEEKAQLQKEHEQEKRQLQEKLERVPRMSSPSSKAATIDDEKVKLRRSPIDEDEYKQLKQELHVAIDKIAELEEELDEQEEEKEEEKEELEQSQEGSGADAEQPPNSQQSSSPDDDDASHEKGEYHDSKILSALSSSMGHLKGSSVLSLATQQALANRTTTSPNKPIGVGSPSSLGLVSPATTPQGILDGTIEPEEEHELQMAVTDLQDELEAAKQVIRHQKLQLKHVQDQLQQFEQEEGPTVDDESDNGESLNTDRHDDVDHTDVVDEGPGFSFELAYKELKKRHIQVELDRALGEFQLRGRISNDVLKYHRRLQHWKDQMRGLQIQLQQQQSDRVQQAQYFKRTLAKEKKATKAAEKLVEEQERDLEALTQDIASGQEQLRYLEQELAKYRPKNQATPELLQQASFLKAAIDRQPAQGVGSRLKTHLGGLLKKGESPNSPQKAMG